MVDTNILNALSIWLNACKNKRITNLKQKRYKKHNSENGPCADKFGVSANYGGSLEE